MQKNSENGEQSERGEAAAWLINFDDPVSVFKARSGGAVLGLLGVVWLLVLLVHLAPTVGLGASDSLTTSVRTDPHPFYGAQYVIEVDGKQYSCSGGHTKLGDRVRVPVRYDRERPGRCRADDVVTGLGMYEASGLLGSSAFALFGLALTLLWSRRRARLWCFCLAVLLLHLGFVFGIAGKP